MIATCRVDAEGIQRITRIENGSSSRRLEQKEGFALDKNNAQHTPSLRREGACGDPSCWDSNPAREANATRRRYANRELTG